MSILNLKNNNHWAINGALTFKNVAAVEAESKAAYEQCGDDITICFDQMSEIDSAGMAWILETIHRCKEKDITLALKNLHSTQANSLAQTHGIDNTIKPFIQ